MGYNRAGNRARQKLRRTRKDERRLAAKLAVVETSAGKPVKRPAKPALPAADTVVEVAKEKVKKKPAMVLDTLIFLILTAL